MTELFFANPEYFIRHWWITLWVSALAAAIAAVVALGLSILGLRVPLVRKITSPVTALSQSFPLQAIAPLIIIAVGAGTKAKLLIAILIAFFPMYVAVANALQQMPNSLAGHLKVVRASFLRELLAVRLPIAAPAIVAAAKIGFTLAVLGTVVSEFIIPNEGLGRLILTGQSQNNSSLIYICVLLLMLQGAFVFGALSLLETRILRSRAAEEN